MATFSFDAWDTVNRELADERDRLEEAKRRANVEERKPLVAQQKLIMRALDALRTVWVLEER